MLASAEDQALQHGSDEMKLRFKKPILNEFTHVAMIRVHGCSQFGTPLTVQFLRSIGEAPGTDMHHMEKICLALVSVSFMRASKISMILLNLWTIKVRVVTTPVGR